MIFVETRLQQVSTDIRSVTNASARIHSLGHLGNGVMEIGAMRDTERGRTWQGNIWLDYRLTARVNVRLMTHHAIKL